MPKTNTPQPTTLGELSEVYLAHLKEEGKTERTLYTYGMDLRDVCGFFGEDKKLAALRPADFGRFLKSDALLKLKTGKPKSEITIKKTVRVMRMMLVWAVDTGVLTKLPLAKDFPMGQSRPAEG